MKTRTEPPFLHDQLPIPSANYKSLQELLRRAIDSRSSGSDERETHIRSLLKTEFQKAFNLKISRGFRGSRKSEVQRLLQHVSDDFDHVDFAKCDGFEGEILISQPYHLDSKANQDAAAKFGYTFTQAEEWTYYSPGSSHLFIVTVTRDVIRRLRNSLDA
jgi:hypothetical protein